MPIIPTSHDLLDAWFYRELLNREFVVLFGADRVIDNFHHFHVPCMDSFMIANIYKLCRGALPTIKDGGGLSALERAMEMGAITDEELFILLSGCD